MYFYFYKEKYQLEKTFQKKKESKWKKASKNKWTKTNKKYNQLETWERSWPTIFTIQLFNNRGKIWNENGSASDFENDDLWPGYEILFYDFENEIESVEVEKESVDEGTGEWESEH